MHNGVEQKGAQERSGEHLQVDSVDLEEMAFAIALFFAAARGQVPISNVVSPGFELRRDLPVRNAALENVTQKFGDLGEAAPDEFSLASAVTVIWHHYEGAGHRQAVCSRLVAFYSIMVRTRGAVAVGRARPHAESSDSIILEPAVIRAVATAPLTPEGQFHDATFRDLVLSSTESEEITMVRAFSSVGSRAASALPVTEIVQDLAKLLFACESTIAVSDSAPSSHFRVFEKLCQPFAAVGGVHTLQPLLSRALVATQSRYTWLRSARATSTGRIEGLDTTFLDSHPEEALQGELAMMGALVELLRSLLGDGVTLQLLRSIWPLAFLKAKHLMPRESES